MADTSEEMTSKAREAWQRLYSRHGLQFGGSGEIAMLEPHLRPESLVLDAGCGDGKTTAALARRADVVGCDFSREALLSLRNQRDPDCKVNLVECNILNLPFESEKFNAVSCVHTLSHLLERDRELAASELNRVLAPGGHVFVEGFGRADIRFGEGERVEDCSFVRGNGIVTHYFQEGEIPSLFEGMSLVAEISVLKRVSLGPRAGKRDLLRVLLAKPG